MVRENEGLGKERQMQVIEHEKDNAEMKAGGKRGGRENMRIMNSKQDGAQKRPACRKHRV